MTTPRSPGRRWPAVGEHRGGMGRQERTQWNPCRALRPAMIQTSLQGSVGGSRSAMVRKNAFSSSDIGNAKMALSTTRQGSTFRHGTTARITPDRPLRR